MSTLLRTLCSAGMWIFIAGTALLGAASILMLALAFDAIARGLVKV